MFLFMFMLRNISFIKMNNYKTFTGRSDIFQLLTHNQHRITGIRYHTYNGHRQYNLFHENRTCIFYTFAQNRDITLGVICSSNLSRLACDVFSISSQNVSSSISTNVFFYSSTDKMQSCWWNMIVETEIIGWAGDNGTETVLSSN